ncbi:MAG: 50S ribosomal protein L30e [Candidatus Helarchaeota archaeon]
MINIDNAIKIAVKTGTVQIGSKKSLRNILNNQAKLVITASNCPKGILDDIETYCSYSNIPIYRYKGTNWDLGFVCGKPFMISVLSILEAGDSDILKLNQEESLIGIESNKGTNEK